MNVMSKFPHLLAITRAGAENHYLYVKPDCFYISMIYYSVQFYLSNVSKAEMKIHNLMYQVDITEEKI